MDESIIRLNPLSDAVFSCIFQDMSGAPAMKELINAVLVAAGEEPIAKIVAMRSQFPQLSKRPKEKSGRLDVKVRAKDGTLFNVEVQLEKKGFFIDRELFYLEKMMAEALQAGKSYQNIPNTRVIAFLDFTLRESHPDIVQPIRFAYSKKPEETASEKIWICNIELPKFKASYVTFADIEAVPAQERNLLRWLYILTEGYLSEEETAMLADETEGMANFADLYNRAIADQDLRDWYEYEQSVMLEENSRRIEEEERQKALKELETAVNQQSKALKEQQKIVEEQQKTVVEQQRTVEEQQRTVEEQQRTVEEQQRTVEEQQRTVEEQRRTVEEQQRTVEEQQRTVEEQQRTVEEQQRTVEQRAKELEARELAVLEQEKRLAELQKQLEASQK